MLKEDESLTKQMEMRRKRAKRPQSKKNQRKIDTKNHEMKTGKIRFKEAFCFQEIWQQSLIS